MKGKGRQRDFVDVRRPIRVPDQTIIHHCAGREGLPTTTIQQHNPSLTHTTSTSMKQPTPHLCQPREDDFTAPGSGSSKSEARPNNTRSRIQRYISGSPKHRVAEGAVPDPMRRIAVCIAAERLKDDTVTSNGHSRALFKVGISPQLPPETPSTFTSICSFALSHVVSSSDF